MTTFIITNNDNESKVAIIFSKATDKVIAAAKRKKDSSKDVELLAQFKGEFPPSLLRVMSGEAVAEGAGFHQIAMQVAVTANALGKTEEDMLSLAEGVVMNHQSDGSRYNSPAKRRNELSRMFRYTQDNVCYPYNRAAVKKLVPKDVAAPDLDGIPVSASPRQRPIGTSTLLSVSMSVECSGPRWP